MQLGKVNRGAGGRRQAFKLHDFATDTWDEMYAWRGDHFQQSPYRSLSIRQRLTVCQHHVTARSCPIVFLTAPHPLNYNVYLTTRYPHRHPIINPEEPGRNSCRNSGTGGQLRNSLIDADAELFGRETEVLRRASRGNKPSPAKSPSTLSTKNAFPCYLRAVPCGHQRRLFGLITDSGILGYPCSTVS